MGEIKMLKGAMKTIQGLLLKTSKIVIRFILVTKGSEIVCENLNLNEKDSALLIEIMTKWEDQLNAFNIETDSVGTETQVRFFQKENLLFVEIFSIVKRSSFDGECEYYNSSLVTETLVDVISTQFSVLKDDDWEFSIAEDVTFSFTYGVGINFEPGLKDFEVYYKSQRVNLKENEARVLESGIIEKLQNWESDEYEADGGEMIDDYYIETTLVEIIPTDRYDW